MANGVTCIIIGGVAVLVKLILKDALFEIGQFSIAFIHLVVGRNKSTELNQVFHSLIIIPIDANHDGVIDHGTILKGQIGVQLIVIIEREGNQAIVGLTGGGSNNRLTGHDEFAWNDRQRCTAIVLISRNPVQFIHLTGERDGFINHHTHHAGIVVSSLEINVLEQIGMLGFLKALSHAIDMGGILAKPPPMLIITPRVSTIITRDHARLPVVITSTRTHRFAG